MRGWSATSMTPAPARSPTGDVGVEVVGAHQQHVVGPERRRPASPGRAAARSPCGTPGGSACRAPRSCPRAIPSAARTAATCSRRRGRQHVVARVAGLEALVRPRVDPLPLLGGERVLRDAEVPPRHPLDQPVEVHPLAAVLGVDQVQAHRLQRRAVVGLQVHLPGALHDVVGEVHVVDEVRRAGQCAVVVAAAHDDGRHPGGHRVLLVRVDDPDAAQPRRELAGLLVDRPRVAGVGGAQ